MNKVIVGIGVPLMFMLIVAILTTQLAAATLTKGDIYSRTDCSLFSTNIQLYTECLQYQGDRLLESLVEDPITTSPVPENEDEQEEETNNNFQMEIPSNITGSDRKTVEQACNMNPNLCSFYIDQYRLNK